MIRLADGRSAYGYWRKPVTNQEIIKFDTISPGSFSREGLSYPGGS